MTSTAARYSLKRTVPPVGEPLSPADVKQHLRITASDEDTLIAGYITAAREWIEIFTNRTLVKSTWQYKADGFACGYRIDDPYDCGLRLPRAPLISVSSIAYLDTNGDSQTLASSVYDVDVNTEPGLVSLAYNQAWPTIRSQRNAITVTYLAGYGATTKTILTLASVQAGDTVTVNGVTFTAHAATTTPANREFSVSGSDAADATALVALLNDQTYGLPAAKVNVSADNLDASGTATARIVLTPTPGTTITATASAATVTIGTSYECTTGESIAAVPETIKAALKLLCGHWYEHREAFAEGALTEVPLAVETLLWGERVLEFE